MFIYKHKPEAGSQEPGSPHWGFYLHGQGCFTGCSRLRGADTITETASLCPSLSTSAVPASILILTHQRSAQQWLTHLLGVLMADFPSVHTWHVQGSAIFETVDLIQIVPTNWACVYMWLTCLRKGFQTFPRAAVCLTLWALLHTGRQSCGLYLFLYRC